MPLFLPGVDESTFKTLTQRTLRLLKKHRGDQAVNRLTLTQLRTAMIEALGYAHLHEAQQAWATQAPGAAPPPYHVSPQRAEPAVTAAPATPPDDITVPKTLSPSPLWQAAMAAFEQGTAAFVAWALAHPRPFEALRWTLPPHRHRSSAKPVSLGVWLLTTQGVPGVLAYHAATEALQAAPTLDEYRAFFVGWQAIKDDDTADVPSAAELWTKTSHWFAAKLDEASLAQAAFRINWIWMAYGKPDPHHAGNPFTPVNDPRVVIYQAAQRRCPQTLEALETSQSTEGWALPPRAWLAAMGDWKRAMQNWQDDDIPIESMVWSALAQPNADSLLPHIQAIPSMTPDACLQTAAALAKAHRQKMTVLPALMQPVMAAAVAYCTQQGHKKLDLEEAGALLGHLIETNQAALSQTLGHLILTAIAGKTNRRGALSPQEKQTLCATLLRQLLNGLPAPHWEAMAAVLLPPLFPGRSGLLNEVVSGILSSWVDAKTGHGIADKLSHDPIEARVLHWDDLSLDPMKQQLRWLHQKGWAPGADDPIWTIWMHAFRFDPTWWGFAQELGASSEGVTTTFYFDGAKNKRESRTFHFVTAGLFHDCLNTEEVNAYLDMGIQLPTSDHAALVNVVLWWGMDTPWPDENVVATMAALGVPRDTWGEYYGQAYSPATLRQWRRLAGGQVPLSAVLRWFTRGLDDVALLMLKTCMDEDGFDLNAAHGPDRQTFLHAWMAALATQETSWKDAELIQSVLALGADPTLLNRQGQTPAQLYESLVATPFGPASQQVLDMLWLGEADHANRQLSNT